jgi:putative nucleotidyltransferase-like protein
LESHLSSANPREIPASAPWALLVECARPNPDLLGLHEQLRGGADWHVLLELAQQHGVFGLLALRLLDSGEGIVPREISEELKERHRAQVMTTLRLNAEMFRLLNGFAVLGVEALVIKGPVLSMRCYGDPGLRNYGDLDLIACDKDLLRVTEMMMGLGYEPRVPVAAIRAKKAPGEYAFLHPRTKLRIEFHTEVTFRYHPRPLPVAKLFEQKASVIIDAHEIPALSPEEELLLICIHGAKHLWDRLSYIADVAAFVSRQKLDWGRVKTAAAEIDAARMLRTALRLAADVLGAPLSDEIEAYVQADPVAERLTRQIMRWLPAAGSMQPGIFERAMFRMRMRGGLFSSAAYLLRLSLSPTEEDWADSEGSKRPRFWDALRRPFRLARKYGRDGKS